MAVPEVDLDDTTNCPVADTCLACSGKSDLSVATLDTSVGVLCMTVCEGCVSNGNVNRLRMGPVAAANMVLTHCGHLDIDLDQAAAVRAAERGER